ncbi:molybdopterin molybdotransferase MoeA [Asticcacaulis sp. BYS171W]|uniref:Molybdopterin molybdenumtransferase n=1 Tax=Asticcacaulis aquaticus TaxID=2984212 RepID=A0ABT5HWH9_9CAUL|nr:gephyrin-like molybdotransferase Glp [Asticcacaulis aquaticus]MDC7684431.1 molybdopterin molybdotransferase MoeA [Asticcacaulis aquaticus]
MISYDEALDILMSEGACRNTETLALSSTVGRVAAQAIDSPRNLPSFDNSAMDGYAVRQADCRLASPQKPAGLNIAGLVTAGSKPQLPTDLRGKAVQIMTGAPIPEGFDAVIPIERVTSANNRLLTPYAPETSENIRRIGEDLIAGTRILRAHEQITAEKLMLCAAAGVFAVEVFRRPKLYVISTGDEVSESSAALDDKTKIFDANGPYLLAAAAREGIPCDFAGRINDTPGQLRAKLETIPPGSVIVSTGGVSAGVHDFVRGVLEKAGAEILFHKAAIKPGKPVLFAKLENGSYFFGLPGNPAAAAVGFRFFVLPLYRALQELPVERPLTGRLNAPVTRKPDLTLFLKASVTLDPDNGLWVDPLDGQESFKIHSLAQANAFIKLTGKCTRLTISTYVDVYPLSAQFPFLEKL